MKAIAWCVFAWLLLAMLAGCATGGPPGQASPQLGGYISTGMEKGF